MSRVGALSVCVALLALRVCASDLLENELVPVRIADDGFCSPWLVFERALEGHSLGLESMAIGLEVL